jgi:hypothetical protein
MMVLETNPTKALLSQVPKTPPKAPPAPAPAPKGISNVIAVYSSIFSGKGVVATPKLENAVGKTIAGGIATAASHPFITAGVATGGVYAAKAIGGGLIAKGAATGAAVGVAGSSLKNLAIAGGAGFIAGSWFGGGGSTKQMQDASVQQTPSQSTTSNQYSKNVSITNANQYVNNINYGSGSIGGSPSLGVSTAQVPSQSVAPYQGLFSDLGQGQSSSNTNWLLIAAIGIGAFMLAKR